MNATVESCYYSLPPQWDRSLRCVKEFLPNFKMINGHVILGDVPARM